MPRAVAVVEPGGAGGPALAALAAPRARGVAGALGRAREGAANRAGLARLREAVRRDCPFGADGWVRETAGRLGVESTLRPRGRPRKVRPTAAPPGDAGLL
jgi:hypothetical protein